MSRWLSRIGKAALIALALIAQSAQAKDHRTAADTAERTIDRTQIASAVTYDRTSTPVQGTLLFLEVEVNGMDHGLAQFRLIDEEVWASRSVLQDLGLRLDDVPVASDDMVSLAEAYGQNFRYNSGAQSLSIIVEAKQLAVATSRLNFYDQDNPVAQSATGLLLNYDLYANFASGRISLDGVTEARAFSGNFLMESVGIFQLGDRGPAGDARFLRLDTSAALTFPENRLTVRMGDIVTRSTSLSRPSRIGGARIGTDFALQPYLITAPVPTFFGEATLPSTVDLYIDGIRRYSADVAPGPFEIGSGPTRVNGAASAELVVTDVLGQVTTLDFPLYDTPLLLREGLSDWSVEIGTVRQNYGQRSFDYANQLVASGSLRRGISDILTVEGHAEVSSSLLNAGGGFALASPGFGVISASIAASQHDGRTGHRFEVGYSFTTSSFNLAATLQRTSNDFADIPSTAGASFPREREIVSAGYSDERLGTFGASLVRQLSDGKERTSYANASWSRFVTEEISLSLSGNINLENTSDKGVFATLTYIPGNRDHYRASVQAHKRRTTGAFGYRRNVPYEGGMGWAVDGSYDGDRFRGAAQFDHLGSFGQATAGARIFGSNTSGYLGYSGAIVAIDGSVHAARKINDGFALVSAAGFADVPVSLNNRRIGVTNGEGRLLVTGLNAYQHNRLSIDTANLPPDIEVGSDEEDAVPSLRAGVTVDFGLAQSHSVLVTVVDQAGVPIPTGTIARTGKNDEALLIIGYDGQLFIEDATPGGRVMVDNDRSPCAFTLPASFPENTAGRLGHVVCSREG
ncbi:fimbria/pilus outer membrane usher protein [Aurantiacibacter zhengii]|nr:fimbria/pilus outer membrane usher protein [Aurantiacibacter zhengii]